jgi:hypothetical protein
VIWQPDLVEQTEEIRKSTKKLQNSANRKILEASDLHQPQQ